MGFLDNYEASRERLERWLATFPNGRIETRIVEFNAEMGYVLVEARAYRDNDMIPAGIDFAYGYQAAYQPNMKRWFVEDTVTSAIMRVQQLVMGGAERSTKEIMEQVQPTQAPTDSKPNEVPDYWTTKFGEIPSYATAEEANNAGNDKSAETMSCQHGQRLWKTGTGKTGKAWGGYFCSEKMKADQCDPVWYMLGSDGNWRIQLP